MSVHIKKISKTEMPIMAQDDVNTKDVAKALIDASNPPYDGPLPL